MPGQLIRTLSPLLVASFLIGCPPPSNQVPGSTAPTGSAAPTSPSLTIGLFQLVDHPAIDQLREGFKEAIAQHGPIGGRSIEFDYQNAQNEPAQIEQIANKYVGDRVDLVYAMGTPCVQSMAQKTRDIPIVVGAMTDPVSAGVAATWDRPGGNVTGTSDQPPVQAQFELAKQLVPTLRRVGLLYNAGESNSTVVVSRVRTVATELGLTVVERTVTSTAEVSAAAESLVGNCDAIYLPPDNTVHAAIPAVIEAANAGRLPVFDCTEDSVRAGALFALGVDYRELGRLSGRMAIDILSGNPPAQMPIRVIDRPSLFLNAQTATRLSLSLSEEVRGRAHSVFPSTGQ